MSIEIDGVELKGESYLTIDSSGCWIWEGIKPEYDDVSNHYVIKSVHDKINEYDQIGAQAVKVMLNCANLDFNFGYSITNGDTPRIFKVTVSEIDNIVHEDVYESITFDENTIREYCQFENTDNDSSMSQFAEEVIAENRKNRNITFSILVDLLRLRKAYPSLTVQELIEKINGLYETYENGKK